MELGGLWVLVFVGFVFGCVGWIGMMMMMMKEVKGRRGMGVYIGILDREEEKEGVLGLHRQWGIQGMVRNYITSHLTALRNLTAPNSIHECGAWQDRRILTRHPRNDVRLGWTRFGLTALASGIHSSQDMSLIRQRLVLTVEGQQGLKFTSTDFASILQTWECETCMGRMMQFATSTS